MSDRVWNIYPLRYSVHTTIDVVVVFMVVALSVVVVVVKLVTSMVVGSIVPYRRGMGVTLIHEHAVFKPFLARTRTRRSTKHSDKEVHMRSAFGIPFFTIEVIIFSAWISHV